MSPKKTILFCFGTRPEAIKLAPLIQHLVKSHNYNAKICVTAQHRDMLDQVLSVFGIEPDFDLDIMIRDQTLFEISSKVLRGMQKILGSVKPDLLIVQGDTSSALFAAVAAYYNKIKIAHVEAGLRSYDKYQPFPEEVNRRLISHFCDINFAPTKKSALHLSRENVPGRIFVTGNTVIDALNEIAKVKNTNLPKGFLPWKKNVLLTVHRRENFGRPLEDILLAVRGIAKKYNAVEIFYPVHPNPFVTKPAYRLLDGISNVHLLKPLDYPHFVKLMSRAYLIVTDSGGLQEEAPAFKKPVLVLREKTERPEAIAFHTARLVGTGMKKVFSAIELFLNNDIEYGKYIHVKNPFGDGKAARRIVQYLDYYFGYSNKEPSAFI